MSDKFISRGTINDLNKLYPVTDIIKEITRTTREIVNGSPFNLFDCYRTGDLHIQTPASTKVPFVIKGKEGKDSFVKNPNKTLELQTFEPYHITTRDTTESLYNRDGVHMGQIFCLSEQHVRTAYNVVKNEVKNPEKIDAALNHLNTAIDLIERK